jgi:hypothetical protein
MIETVGVVLICIVGPEVDICADLHLLGEDVKNVLLEERVSNLVRGW